MQKKQRGFSLIELLIVIVIVGLFVLISIYFIRIHMENSKKDSLIDTAYFFIDTARNQLASENALPDLDKALIISYEDFKENLKKGGSSPYNNQEYDPNSTYVAIINRNGKLHFYVAIEDTAQNCLVMLSEDDVKAGSRNLRSYVKKGEHCQITPIDYVEPMTFLIYKGGEEEKIEHGFSIY